MQSETRSMSRWLDNRFVVNLNNQNKLPAMGVVDTTYGYSDVDFLPRNDYDNLIQQKVTDWDARNHQDLNPLHSSDNSSVTSKNTFTQNNSVRNVKQHQNAHKVESTIKLPALEKNAENSQCDNQSVAGSNISPAEFLKMLEARKQRLNFDKLTITDLEKETKKKQIFLPAGYDLKDLQPRNEIRNKENVRLPAKNDFEFKKYTNHNINTKPADSDDEQW